jgi:hypothetical protein
MEFRLCNLMLMNQLSSSFNEGVSLPSGERLFGL